MKKILGLVALLCALPGAASAAAAIECPRGTIGDLCRQVQRLDAQGRALTEGLAANNRKDTSQQAELESLRRRVTTLEQRANATDQRFAQVEQRAMAAEARAVEVALRFEVAEADIDWLTAENRRLLNRQNIDEMNIHLVTELAAELRGRLEALANGLGDGDGALLDQLAQVQAELLDRLAHLEAKAAEGGAGAGGAGCGDGERPVCCPEGTEFCNGMCSDTGADPRNCGGCNIQCGFNGRCVEGACEGGEPPPRGASFLACPCADGTRAELCFPIDCDPDVVADHCGMACERRGGLAADVPVHCEQGSPRCGGEPQPPPVPHGDKLLTCVCADEQRAAVCVETDCSAEQRDALCGRICGDRGVSREFPPSCFADQPQCAGDEPPPPPPAASLTCPCAAGPVEMCVPSDCNPQDQARHCSMICERRGGMAPGVGLVCERQSPRCGDAPPPPPPPAGDKFLTCVCADGTRGSACVDTDCSAAQRDALCGRFCGEHGGADPEFAPSCFADVPQCVGEEPPPPRGG